MLSAPLAICRLAPGAPAPAWSAPPGFRSITHTAEELSIVCDARAVPPDVLADRGWRALKLLGPFDLSLVGILLGVAAPLAAAGVSVFPIATYDTDYLLVREDQLATALHALTAAGHSIERLSSQ